MTDIPLTEADTPEALVSAAEHTLAGGDVPGAIERCQSALDAEEGLTLDLIERIAVILDAAGQRDEAVKLIDMMIEVMKRILTEQPGNLEVTGNLVQNLFMLDRHEEAQPYLTSLIEKMPADMNGAMMAAHLEILRGDPDAALQHFMKVFEHNPDAGRLRLQAASMFSHFEHPEQAEICVRLAEPLCEDVRNEFLQVAAAVRGETDKLSQLGLTVEIYETYAPSYDKNMKGLMAAGPMAIAEMVRQIGVPKDASLDIFDAGCGTGLCAPYLRPYAKTLHGADASVGMLQEALSKEIYDQLTRTDLNNPETYPSGPFDMIVSSDVFVYFGELTHVLGHFMDRLRPGGWVLITVEKAGRNCPENGFEIGPSGRYRHSEGYLRKAFAKVGALEPAVVSEGVLRREYLSPVNGIAMAAQKPAQ